MSKKSPAIKIAGIARIRRHLSRNIAQILEFSSPFLSKISKNFKTFFLLRRVQNLRHIDIQRYTLNTQTITKNIIT